MEDFRARASESSLCALAERHYARAEALARWLLRDGQAARDAVQDTFLRVLRARSTYRPGQPFGPWFYAILRHACADIQRRRARAPVPWDEVFPEPVDGQPAGIGIEIRELRERAGEDWPLLMLRLGHGLPFRDLGVFLGCAEEAAKKRCQRALARLRAGLARAPGDV